MLHPVFSGFASTDSLEATSLTNDTFLAKVGAIVASLALVVAVVRTLGWSSWEAGIRVAWDVGADTVEFVTLAINEDTWCALGNGGTLVDGSWGFWSRGSGGSGDEEGYDGEEVHFEFCVWLLRNNLLK